MPIRNYQLLNMIANVARREGMQLEIPKNVFRNFFSSTVIVLGTHYCYGRCFGSSVGRGYFGVVVGFMVGSIIAYKHYTDYQPRLLADILLNDLTVDQQALLISLVTPLAVHYRSRPEFLHRLMHDEFFKSTIIELLEYFVEDRLSEKYPGYRLTRKSQ